MAEVTVIWPVAGLELKASTTIRTKRLTAAENRLYSVHMVSPPAIFKKNLLIGVIRTQLSFFRKFFLIHTSDQDERSPEVRMLVATACFPHRLLRCC